MKAKKVKGTLAAALYALAVLLSVTITLCVAGFGKPAPEQKAELISRQRELTNGQSLKLKEDDAGTAANDDARRYAVPLDDDIQAFAAECCEETGIPIELLYAMIWTESRFEPNAINNAGDSGLLQINNRYASVYGATDLLDPYQNIRVGTEILSGYLEDYPDDLEKALMSYNCGPTRAAELWAEGITSTQYTEEVKAALWALKEKGEIEL